MINEEALEAARLAIENELIELRDSRIGVLGCGNGFMVREKDGSPSNVIRLATRQGLRIAIKTYLSCTLKDNTGEINDETREINEGRTP